MSVKGFWNQYYEDQLHIFSSKKDIMVEAFAQERTDIVKKLTVADGKVFCDKIMVQANEVNEVIKKFRKTIEDHINLGASESYLKSPYKAYENCIPLVSLEKLQKVLNHDVYSCEGIEQRAIDAVPQVEANFEKFQADWTEKLNKFIVKQKHLLYGVGNTWRPNMDEFVKTKVHGNENHPIDKEWP